MRKFRAKSLVAVFVITTVSFLGGYLFNNRYAVQLQDGVKLTTQQDLRDLKINIINKQRPREIDLEMGPFWKAVELLEENYLDSNKISGKKLLYGAIEGMVKSVGDPYTAFYTPEENVRFKNSLEGHYEGIGAQLGFKDEQLAIVAPLENSPAERAGIRAGDLILAVDNDSTKDWSIPRAVNRIRGKAGSQVVLTIARQQDTLEKGEDSSKPVTKEISIKREQITIPAVRLTWATVNGKPTNVAHIRVLRFGSDTADGWDQVIKEAKLSGASKVVLDLRNNPGGYLQAAIYLASEFFEDGVVVKRQTNQRVKEYKVDHPCRLCKIPVAVLINKGSASASEILAGAIQSRRRGILVGERSFGKGTVQDAIELSGGAGIHITTARWLLPNDENIHEQGLKPDYEVEEENPSGPFGSGENDVQFQKAVEVLVRDMK